MGNYIFNRAFQVYSHHIATTSTPPKQVNLGGSSSVIWAPGFLDHSSSDSSIHSDTTCYITSHKILAKSCPEPAALLPKQPKHPQWNGRAAFGLGVRKDRVLSPGVTVMSDVAIKPTILTILYCTINMTSGYQQAYHLIIMMTMAIYHFYTH